MIPARVRGEWSRLRGKGISSIWAPASQDSSHVGNAGVGVVSLRGAPLALPTFATAQFRSVFDCGRAVRCLLPLASGRFLHLFVLCGYLGAYRDDEQLALTEQLFDAASGELHTVASGQPCLLVVRVVARGQPSVLVGDFNVEPTKIPCLAKGISAGLWVDFGEAWALAAGLHPAPTCERGWTAAGGHRRDFILGCPLAALFLTMNDGSLGFRSLSSVLPFGLLLGCLLLIRVVVPSPLRFREFGRYMMSDFNLCLVGMPLCLMSLLVGIMFLWLGLSGLVLLSLLLLMRSGLVVVLFLPGA